MVGTMEASAALGQATAVDRLDFSMLRAKLMDHEEGLGWSEAQCRAVEAEYRRYLRLTQLHGAKSLVPSQLVDIFWHFHILDTQAYVQDCDELFGAYLHHFPYFGMRGEADARALSDAYDDTLGRYAAEFGDPPDDIWPAHGMTRCPKCGRA